MRTNGNQEQLEAVNDFMILRIILSKGGWPVFFSSVSPISSFWLNTFGHLPEVMSTLQYSSLLLCVSQSLGDSKVDGIMSATGIFCYGRSAYDELSATTLLALLLTRGIPP